MDERAAKRSLPEDDVEYGAHVRRRVGQQVLDAPPSYDETAASPVMTAAVASQSPAPAATTPPTYAAAEGVAPITPYVMDQVFEANHGQVLSVADIARLIVTAPDCVGLVLTVGLALINLGSSSPANAHMVTEGVAMLTCAAEEKGDAMAHFLLGSRLVHSAPDAAERHLRIAARGGVAPAFAYIGQLIKKRGGTNGNLSEALSFFKQGALFDDPEAHYATFTMLLVGLDCAKDPVRALDHLRRAAELGHKQAMFRYGEALRLGKGVAVDVSSAITFHARAAAKGHEQSALILGHAYRKGTAPLARNYIDAHKWYNRAIEQPEAKYQVARLLVKGRVPREDGWEAAAEGMLRQASQAGHVRATYRLGLLELRRGADSDKDKARQLFKQAAQNGYAGAYKRLAKMAYDAGKVDEAIFHLHKGAQANDAACMLRLGEVYLDPSGPASNHTEGIRLIVEAAQKGYLKAKIAVERRGLHLRVGQRHAPPVTTVIAPSLEKRKFP